MPNSSGWLERLDRFEKVLHKLPYVFSSHRPFVHDIRTATLGIFPFPTYFSPSPCFSFPSLV